MSPCHRGTQGPGPGDKKEGSGWAPRQRGGLGGQGWPRAYLTPHVQVQGHQAWLKPGGGPQQQVGGWRCPRLPHRAADQEDLAEVEFVRESLAFALVQDALVVVIPARPGENGRSDGPVQAPQPDPSPSPPQAPGKPRRPSGSHAWEGRQSGGDPEPQPFPLSSAASHLRARLSLS